MDKAIQQYENVSLEGKRVRDTLDSTFRSPTKYQVNSHNIYAEDPML